MANTLGYYNPLFYAQEALIQLEKALGMAGRIHRGYDRERRAFRRGEYINISRPGTFTAQDAPSTAQDLTPDSVQMQLAYWREVKFKLTDKELAFTTEKMIEDHIRPAAVALADDIDTKLCALYSDIPWYYDVTATAAVSDITQAWKILFDNKVPTADAANMHWMLDSDMTADFMANSAFSQWQGAGETGVQTQRTGTLGRKFGFEFFTNQNVAAHTPGTYSSSPTATTTIAKGATSATLAATTLTGTLKQGDTFVIAGNAQRYAVLALATASSNSITVTFTPPAVQAYSSAAVTVSLDTHSATLAFHKNAFALAMAPLSEMGNELGAKIATIQDPITGLAIRSRLYYMPDSSYVAVALDILYGVKTLDPNLACRGRN